MALSRHATGHANNATFYRGNRRSPWWAVAFGMLGASLSGVTFVSVPGMVATQGMTYMQMCLGFVPGYLMVAFVLLPVYYRLDLTSIYTYLGVRLGSDACRAGAAVFLVSKFAGASVRLFLVCVILQGMAGAGFRLPMAATAAMLLLMVWLYTRRGGIGAIVWTDCLQTLVMLLSVVLIVAAVLQREGWSVGDAVRQVAESPMSRLWQTSDPSARNYLWKQFVSGAFIVVVMTGLDQDMMQKNLTCRTLRQSQTNMVVNGLLYLPVNLLFLSAGVLLYTMAAREGIVLPAKGDAMLPALVGSGELGDMVPYVFALGVAAAAFSSADSALTALTTSFCVDLVRRPADEALRRRVHAAMCVAMWLFILLFDRLSGQSVIDAVYTLASYTYGPLLGLFAYAALSKGRVPRAWLLYIICIFVPAACYALTRVSSSLWGYSFGYELLLVNACLVAVCLWLTGWLVPAGTAAG